MGGKCGTGSTRHLKGYIMITFKLCMFVYLMGKGDRTPELRVE